MKLLHISLIKKNEEINRCHYIFQIQKCEMLINFAYTITRVSTRFTHFYIPPRLIFWKASYSLFEEIVSNSSSHELGFTHSVD